MTTEVQKTNRKVLQKWIEGGFTDKINEIFSHNASKVSRFKQSLMIQCNQNPKILECEPESILTCAYQIALSGLLPDGRNAYLVPYGQKCTVLFDYKGYVRQILNSPEHQSVNAVIVFENEEFEIEFGDITKHKTILNKEVRGSAIGCYSVLTYTSGGRSFCFMSREEIEAIRDKSQDYKYKGAKSIWAMYPSEMWKKTVLRRHQKMLRLNVDAEAAFEIEDPGLFAARPKNEPAPNIFDMEESPEEPAQQEAQGVQP